MSFKLPPTKSVEYDFCVIPAIERCFPVSSFLGLPSATPGYPKLVKEHLSPPV